MFQRLLSFVIILLFFFNLCAQKSIFHIGGAANFNNCWILNQNNYGTLDGFNNIFAKTSELDYTLTFGGGVGVVTGLNFTKRHGIQTGLFFDKAGQMYNGMIDQTDPTESFDIPTKVTRNVKLNYFKIPILYKYELVPLNRSRSKTVNYYFEVGPQIALKLSVYEEVKIDNPDIDNNLSNIPENEKFRNFDIGLTINNGVQIRLTKTMYINTGLNIYFGLIDINGKTIRELEYFSSNDVSYKPSHNFTIGFNAGFHYLFTSNRYY